MTKHWRCVVSIAAILCCTSCAKVLPESSAERKAIVAALDRHHGPSQRVYVGKVKVYSNKAIVNYSASGPPEAQVASYAAKATLVKTNGVWGVQGTKADVPVLTQILMPNGK
jgi:hypothetical protein